MLNVLGWIGAALLLWSFLNTTLRERWSPTSTINLWTNLAGAALIVVHGSAAQVWPPVVINLVWMIFSAAKLFGKLRR